MKQIENNRINFLRFGFYSKKLTISEILLILSLFIFEFYIWLFRFRDVEINLLINLESVTFVTIWWLPLAAGLSNLFRNIYFGVSWLLICIIWFLIKEDLISAVLPIIIFFYIQFARLIFKSIFKYEPVFLIPSKFRYSKYSKIEKRKTNTADFVFTMLTFIVGGIMSILIANI